MRGASLKARLREAPQFGCFVTFPSPGLTEFTARLGFDFTLLDAEHGAMDTVEVEDMIRASQAAGRRLRGARALQPPRTDPARARQRR